MVKPASMTNRNRLGFDFPGSNPLAGRRRVENLSGFLLSGRFFVMANAGLLASSGSLERDALRETLRRFMQGFSACRHHKTSSSDRQSASANGPAWAALKKHRLIQRYKVRAMWPPARVAFRSDHAKPASQFDKAHDPRNGCRVDRNTALCVQ